MPSTTVPIDREKLAVALEAARVGRDMLAEIVAHYDALDAGDVVDDDRAFVTALTDLIDFTETVLGAPVKYV